MNTSLPIPARVGFKNLLGKRFGRWLVVDYCGPDAKSAQVWQCRCDCGNEKPVKATSLQNGHSASCGCLRNERANAVRITHGESRVRNGKGTKEYKAWRGMRERCSSPNPKYKDYYGRGIQVCERWRNSFQTFLADVGRAPSNRHSIDRIDVNGNYEPSNVCWSLPFDQTNNRTTSSRYRSARGSTAGALSFGA